MTSGEGKGLAEHHPRYSCIGMAESGSFDFQQEFRWANRRDRNGLDDVFESKVSKVSWNVLHDTHFSPGVTTLAARMVSGSVEVIGSVLDVCAKVCMYIGDVRLSGWFMPEFWTGPAYNLPGNLLVRLRCFWRFARSTLTHRRFNNDMRYSDTAKEQWQVTAVT